MTVLLRDSFENGLGLWNASPPSDGSIVTTHARTGTHCYKYVATGSSSNATLGFTLSSLTSITGRIYLWFDALPTVDVNALMILAEGNSAFDYELGFSHTTNVLKVSDRNAGAHTDQLGSTVIAVGQWYLVDFQVDFRTTSAVVTHWKVNGVAQTDGAWGNTGDSSTARMDLGPDSFFVTDTFTCFYDEALLDNNPANYPLGPVADIAALPALPPGAFNYPAPGIFFPQPVAQGLIFPAASGFAHSQVVIAG